MLSSLDTLQKKNSAPPQIASRNCSDPMIGSIANILVLTILFYGIFSEPTPDNFSLNEIILGAILLVLGALSFIAKSKSPSLEVFYYLNVFVTVYGFLSGYLNGTSLQLILRDLIPWLYIVLAIRLAAIGLLADDVYRTRVAIALASTGAIFCLKHFYENSGTGLSLAEIGSTVFVTYGKYYLVEPSVLFLGLITLSRLFNSTKVLPYFVAALGFVLFFFASSSQVLRGYIYVALIFLLYLSWQMSIYWKILIFLPSLFFVYFTLPSLSGASGVIELVIQKQLAAGSNSRFTEFQAVFESIFESISFFIAGTGWGGEMLFGYGLSRYTHNFIAYIFFKLGFVVGLIYLILSFWVVFKNINFRALFKDSIALSAALSLSYFFLIQPGFKMLSLVPLFPLVFCMSRDCFHNSN